jgi:predicted amidohydrolase
MNAAHLAEPTQGRAYQWMTEKAAHLHAVVTGSIIAEVDGQYFNRLLWVRPDGTFDSYDKRHLFTLAGEEKVYQPGQTHLLTELKGWTIMPLICYDLRFPVWSRNTMGYDLLIYVANWPSKRRNAWKSLLVARAIENQAYTIGVNRVGEDGNGFPHAGDTCILDYAGASLLQATDVESVFTVTLNPEKQDEFRSKLRFLDDRDIFELK